MPRQRRTGAFWLLSVRTGFIRTYDDRSGPLSRTKVMARATHADSQNWWYVPGLVAENVNPWSPSRQVVRSPDAVHLIGGAVSG
ncbi:hypothetical protein M2432_001128 [Mycobacterium sp. OTB74]|nr:hypothetical protein [Mycobacterium sp. OTB74]